MAENEMTKDRLTDNLIRPTDNSLKDADFEGAHQEARPMTQEEIASYIESLNEKEEDDA